MRKKGSMIRWMHILPAAALLCAGLPVTAMAAQAPSIQSVTGITEMSIYGQQLSAVAIEYDSAIDAASLSTDTYEVSALITDTFGETGKAPVAAVYTNNEAAKTEDGTGREGNYVIVELDINFKDGTNLDNNIGRLVTTYYEEDGTKALEYWCADDDMDYLKASVTQTKAVKAEDGSEAAEAENVSVDQWINLGMDDFDEVTITNTENPEEYQALHINYRLPENYDPAKKYPLVVQLAGGGCSYYEATLKDGTVINNNGTNLAFDPAALTWLDAGEDVIIASVHTRFVMGGTYDAASDIIVGTKYMIDNFSVDTNRVIMTGNSAGTSNGGLAILADPDLFTAAILCNGNAFSVNCGLNPFTGATSDPYGMSEENLNTIVDSGVALFFCHGIGDTMANYYESYEPYQEILNACNEKGEGLVNELVYDETTEKYSSLEPANAEEASQKLRIRLFSEEDMNAVNLYNYHGATKYAYYMYGDDLMSWALAQTKQSEPESSIVSVTAINDMGFNGLQLAAVALEYDQNVDLDSLDLETYDVQALVVDTDGETASAPVRCVYTNDKPEMDPELKGNEGNYVIVELEIGYLAKNTVGRKISTYYYDAEDGTRASKGYWYVPLEDLKVSVTQQKDVQAEDGTVYAATSKKVSADSEVNLKTDEFCQMILPSDADGTDLHILYHLPEGYDSSKKYPMVVQLVGGGVSYWEVNGVSNFGCSIAFDNSAVSWLDAPEDVIIISVHSRFDLFNNTPPTEIIQAVRYFEANYSVDTDRVYMTGNSFGTIMANRAMRMAPELFAGAILCNGNLGLGQIPGPGSDKDTDPTAIEEALSEIIDQRIALWFNTGRNDSTAKSPESIVPYETLKAVYQNQGMSDTQIDSILRISVFENSQMNALGITNYHQATRYAYYTQAQEMMAWMLGQSKANSRTPELAPLTVSEKKITKNYGDKSFRLVASTADGCKLTYSSSDTSVVKVSSKGTVSIVGAGKAVITITASGEGYAVSTATVTIKVRAAKVASLKLKTFGSGKVKAYWKKNAQAASYEIQYSDSKSFAGAKTVKVSKGTSVVKTLPTLKKNKTYYVRIRAIGGTGSNTVTGLWSSTASVKVK